jgi:hypothetical protein
MALNVQTTRWLDVGRSLVAISVALWCLFTSHRWVDILSNNTLCAGWYLLCHSTCTRRYPWTRDRFRDTFASLHLLIPSYPPPHLSSQSTTYTYIFLLALPYLPFSLFYFPFLCCHSIYKFPHFAFQNRKTLKKPPKWFNFLKISIWVDPPRNPPRGWELKKTHFEKRGF